MLIAAGLVLLGVGAALLVNLGGSAKAVIRRVTSRNLGDLAPGYAASAAGFRVYATLIASLGVVVCGVGVSAAVPLPGVAAILLGVAVFAIASVLAITGEVRAYRALTRQRKGAGQK